MVINKILLLIYREYINISSNEKKIEYLRKMGMKIGDRTRILSKVSFAGTEPYLITIGNDCLISGDVHIFTHDGGVSVLNSLYYSEHRMDKVAPVKIGNNCFIGNGVKILPNVVIGDNVVIGAGSIVTKNIPSNSVAAGVPARVISTIENYHERCKFNIEETVKMTLKEKEKFYRNKYNL